MQEHSQAGAGCWFWFWPHHTKAHKDGEHMLHAELGPGEGVSPEGVHSKRKNVSKNTLSASHSHTHTGNTPAPSLTLDTQG